MYKYLIGFVLCMPLTGIWLVEQGELAMTLGLPGEPNGATFAFSLYVAVVVAVALWCGGRYRNGRWHRQGVLAKDFDNSPAQPSSREYSHFSKNLLSLNAAFLLVMLFGFGGIEVWLGTTEKGLFRVNLGPLGSVAYLMTKFAIPALFAYASVLFLRTTRSSREKWLWIVNAVFVVLVGSTWGFKTTGVFMLLPGVLILNWRMPFYKLVVLSGIFLGALVVFFYWFDAPIMEDIDVLPFLFARLTILQGDVAWHIWGLYAQGEPLPNYWPTLLAALGDTVFTIFGLSRDNHVEWMSYHYDWMITFLSGAPLEQIANGHSITATPFAEGIIAGGWAGVALFSVVAGLLVGRTYYYIDRAMVTGRSRQTAILATYFCFHTFAWLTGGAITQLFHISILVNLAVTYLLLQAMSLQRRSRPHTPGAVSVDPSLLPQPH